MKIFTWDEDKNRLLKRQRGVSFEDVIIAIECGRLHDILEHPNPARFGHQRLYVVELDTYIYIVPFVTTDSEIQLKTIFPSRKYTRLYLMTKEV